MTTNFIPGINRPVLPTLADIQRRRAELLGTQSQPHPQIPPPLPTPEPQPTPPPRASAELKLGQAALYGPAGLAVRTIAPHTEAHPAAVLLQLLAAFGNAAGAGPHCMVDATRHGLNLFVVLVGQSSKARKGTSWNQICRLFSEVDHDWVANRVTTARLSPIGLIYTLRDQQPATDRRLLALSEEFASVLHTVRRAKGRLSPLLRSAWDSGNLRSLDGREPIQATGAHISLIAHITQRELAQLLHPTEAHNGFANRCLWTNVQRSNCLPEGGSLGAHELSAVAGELRRALEWAHSAPEILFRRDEAARELWHDIYPALSQARPGLHGAATSRAEAQVLRLSAIYAALDCSSVIEPPHLHAALEVWEFCSASASLLFGTCTGDPTADRIREALNASPDGLSRKQISALFHGHLSSDHIDAALEHLMSLGAVNQCIEPGRGRPTTLWSGIPDTESIDEESAQEET
jgi:hypothetical protein